MRPEEAKKEKPVVSQYVRADIDRIMTLEPDLVLGFSDLQADICAELIRRGVQVHCFNQRSIDEILANNQKQVETYRGGKTSVLGFFVGQVMKATRGQAAPKAVNELLRKALG